MNTLDTTPLDGFHDYSIEAITPLEWDSVTYAGDITFTQDGQIVCIEQSRGIDITGGHRDPGESPLEAVTREVREEIGHDIYAPAIVLIRE
jgi:8-oxo-dGTP pyrophosphatase MutT (NUDIX family)